MIRVEHIPAAHSDAAVAVVTIDRQEKRNALTPSLLENIAGVAKLVHTGRGRAHAVVLAGAGPGFCAGFDLDLCRDDPMMMGDLLTRLSHAVRALRNLTVPVVAAAHGAAIAGGCALLSGCDLVVTDAGARLGYPVVRLGVSPAVSGSTLRLAIGGARTRERFLDPGLINGTEALRIGLAHECVESPEDVLPRAIELASDLARKPHHAVVATKRWLNELDGSNNSARHDAALRASLAIAGGHEEQQRLAAIWSKP
ncbi:MAG: enoyl-CoA hydratase/isomerase family protein [Phycisphaeraceae bacterium]|nr:enoyl-CoA hydratase/isomerase family protein [Phycisphaeraceae bacterium]MCB9848058.1 enoyl-CoA hydratase/isomerase family protein [Phycisphaeraceae bacterium]